MLMVLTALDGRPVPVPVYYHQSRRAVSGFHASASGNSRRCWPTKAVPVYRLGCIRGIFAI
ncbi:hypothetical protein KCP76_17090 [Salmonella enterica subsp. enterica serovar Weltevreden]|nr:hypothetical protein KCP76_17090 [Salmonella enterica subsp. enterica serovar Weltevreden]